MEPQARELATSFIQGNRSSVCLTVLADSHAPQLAAMVTRKLCRLSFEDADVFIRLLEHNAAK